MTRIGNKDHLHESCHGLETPTIQKVLLPSSRADLAGKVSELVKRAFPRGVAQFQQDLLWWSGIGL